MPIPLLSIASLIILGSFADNANARERLVFESSERQTQLVELYTSEGCSSCPPADRWYSQLSDNDDLWNRFVPVAFHVTYWDYLGWKDRYSNRAFDARQRERADFADAVVYTPGVFVDGQEYRSWRKRRSAPVESRPRQVGRLRIEIDQDIVTATFTGSSEQKQLNLELALLANNQSTEVRAGENRGKSLQHDFVVATLQSTEMKQKQGVWQAKMRLSKPTHLPANAVAAWIADSSGQPQQATGGWLK